MKVINSLLLATDFTSATSYAQTYAGYLAKSFDASLKILHVFPGTQPNQEVTEPELKEASFELEKIKTDLSADGIADIKIFIKTGQPASIIVDTAQLEDVNLIVISSGEKSFSEKFILGVTAEKILQYSTKPVLVVRRGFKPPVKRILCPIDFSEHSRRGLKHALALARQFDAELTVMTVLPPAGIFQLKQISAKKRVTKLKSELSDFLKGFDFTGVTWFKEIREGIPHIQIIDMALELRCDLMVMGTMGLSSQARFFIGSVAKKVLRELPCSVLTVKTEDMIQLRYESSLHDLESYFDQGKKLLEKGFAEEALRMFKQCVETNVLFAPAWEAMSVIYQRLNNPKEAARCRAKAHEIQEKLWEKRVEAEIRGQHAVLGKQPKKRNN
ncbi:universal stress protein [bacterium]|nr:universal stress protein [candidate division CSSED10-310 bacterium]